MNIYEYEAKALLAKYNIHIPRGIAILRKEEIDSKIDGFTASTYVVKGQIYAGGRGKAGGIQISQNKDKAKLLANELWGKTLVTPQTGPEGQKIRRLYIEEGCNIEKEYYVSLVVDRSKNSITIIASSEGGMDIEEVAEKSPEKIIKSYINLSTGIQQFNIRQIAVEIGLDKALFKKFAKILNGLYKAFIETDADQIEINPLVITAEGELAILDAKINFDDNALYKHPEIAKLADLEELDPLEVEAHKKELSYIKIDGNIGCMVNGAGLAMATMDIIKLYGGEPANFLDVGGNADKEKVTAACKIIIADPKVKAILVNIFGGIMRCDIIAEGIISAIKDINLKLPLVVRLAGTNADLGKKIIADSGLNIIAASDLEDAAKKVVNASVSSSNI